MHEERPIVFTITEYEKDDYTRYYYDITTTDPRGKSENITGLTMAGLFLTMSGISRHFNNKGYAVLFEVD